MIAKLLELAKWVREEKQHGQDLGLDAAGIGPGAPASQGAEVAVRNGCHLAASH